MKLLKSKRIVSLLLALVIFGTMFFGDLSNVEAAGRRVNTSVQYRKNWQKAPSVKTGKTTVNCNVPMGTVKFVAPKTKVYKITVTNLVNTREKSAKVNGFFNIRMVEGSKNYQYLTTVPFKTYGGKTTTLWVANNQFMKDWNNGKSPKTSHYRTSRTAEIKLQKGQAIFLSSYFGDKEKVRYSVTIK